MTSRLQLKICGITSLPDARAAVEAGADYLGFILYPKSSRYLSVEKYRELRRDLPPVKKVAVLVEPDLAELNAALGVGFDFFQVHFRPDVSMVSLSEWTEIVSPARLWLAPKLAGYADVSPLLLPMAGTFLFDTYHPQKFGGTGETGDWLKFRRHQGLYPRKTWILSGGLSPANVSEAIQTSSAKFLDVNSGVELSPGVKDPTKLRALAAALRGLAPVL